MKITPLEIRQKTFEKVFRGYDKDEVSAFLQIMSEEWIKSNDEKKSLEIKLEGAEKEIAKLREVESSLYKTLKTAEDTGANMIEQANKAAELQLKETQIKAEHMVREAKAKANLIIGNSEKRAKDIIGKMLTEFKSLENNFNAALNLKENLIADLTNLSSATLERAQKFKKQKDKLDIEKYIKEAREFAENYDLKNIKFGIQDADDTEDDDSQFRIGFKKAEKQEKPEKSKQQETKAKSENTENSEKSFFDLLE
jgi:cell division initiation protein